MFKLLKRLLVHSAPQPAPRTPRKPSARRVRPRDETVDAAPAAPDVVEGNSEQDWALWEDSVAMLDSQMQPLAAGASGYDKLPSSQFDDADAYAGVRKRDR